MSGFIALGVIVAIAVILWWARKAGRDAARAAAAEEVVRDVVEANKPVTDADRQRMRERFGRD